MYPLKKLWDICEFHNGLWTWKEPPFINVGVIRNTNFRKDWFLDDSDIAYLDVEIKQYEKRRLKYGDIIIEKSGWWPKQPVWRVITFEKKEGEYSFSNFTSVIRIKDSNEVNFKYLHRFLYLCYISWITEWMQSYSTGIRNLNFVEYKEILIPLPPLSTQLDIVARLDSAMAEIETLRNETESALASIREIWESTLGSVFASGGKDWEEKTLNEIIKIKHGFAFKSEYFSFEWNYVLLTPGNFYEKWGYRERWEKQKYYMGDFPESYILVEWDLLVAMTEQAPWLLWSPILIPEWDKFLHNQRLWLIGFIWERKLQNEFLFHFFNTKFVRREIHDSASGTKVRHTSPEKIGKVRISFPSLSEQSRIVAHLDAVRSKTERLEILYTKKLASLDELKRSVLAEAFL